MIVMLNRNLKKENYMPELPEVEAFKKYISSHCKNKTIHEVDIFESRVIKKISPQIFKKKLIGKKFTKIEREGKYLVLSISSDLELIMHFGLTGYPFIGQSEQKVRFACVAFEFTKTNCLYWCDVRKFGRLYLIRSADEIKGIKDLGTDALKISESEFLNLGHDNAHKNIKTFLMDQTTIAGIGNEYSDEILFQARVDPRHKIKDLADSQLKKIYQKMRTVLLFATKVRIKHLSLLNTQRLFSAEDTNEFPRSYLQAHRHGDGKCPKNSKHVLKKVTIGGRSAYYCSIDQK